MFGFLSSRAVRTALLWTVVTGVAMGVPTVVRAAVGVAVRDGGFVPASVTVEVGEPVTFTFEAGGHAVRAEPDDTGVRVFDSHPRCGPGPLARTACAAEGETFSWAPQQPVQVVYFCPVHTDMRGTITVAAAEPSPGPAPSPSDSASPAPRPSSTATASPTGAPSTAPSPTQSPIAAETTTPPPSPTGTDAATEEPTVAPSASTPVTPPEPEFEEFPEPVEPTTPSSEDVPGMVEIGGSEGDADAARIVVASLAGVAVLGTLGLFGRTVLFGAPWVAGRDEGDPS